MVVGYAERIASCAGGYSQRRQSRALPVSPPRRRRHVAGWPAWPPGCLPPQSPPGRRRRPRARTARTRRCAVRPQHHRMPRHHYMTRHRYVKLLREDGAKGFLTWARAMASASKRAILASFSARAFLSFMSVSYLHTHTKPCTGAQHNVTATCTVGDQNVQEEQVQQQE
eukprot:COSAG05_NODE_3816_length_1822_cov_9.051015_2_plen_169_part_00